jgi:predicted membrane protein
MQNSKTYSPVRICAIVGIIYTIILVVMAYWDLSEFGKDDRQIHVVVVGKRDGIDFPVQFELNGVIHKQKLQSSIRNLKNGDKIQVWITKNDPTSIQINKPVSYDEPYKFLLIFYICMLVLYIISYIYKPSLVCWFFVFSVIFSLVGFIITKIKK